MIAGCYVLTGKVVRNADIRVFRKTQEVFLGKVNSLKRFKDDVKEVAAGFECGIVIEKFDKFETGDVIRSFERRTKK